MKKSFICHQEIKNWSTLLVTINLGRLATVAQKFVRLLSKVNFFTNKVGVKLWFFKSAYQHFIIAFQSQAHLSTFDFWCTGISSHIKFYVHQKWKVLKWAWNWNPIMKCWYADLKNHDFSPTLSVKKLTLFIKCTNFSSRSPIFQGWLWPVGLTNFWFLDGKWKIFS